MSFAAHPAALDYAGFATALRAVNPELMPRQIAGFIEATEALVAGTDMPTHKEAAALGVRKLAEVTIANPRKVRIYWHRPRLSPRAPATAPRLTRALPRAARAPRRRRTAGARAAESRAGPDPDEPAPLTAAVFNVPTAERGSRRHGGDVPMDGRVISFPLRRAGAVLICRERGTNGRLAICGSHGWLFGSFRDACTEAKWLSHKRGGLPIRAIGGAA
jgi:hypothetical protein